MRHRKAGKKLGRNTSHRRALLRNLVTSLIMEERIETTVSKAKAMRPQVEKMITLGKRGDVAARRLAAAYLMTREAVDKLFDTIAPRMGDRNGGYLRIIRRRFPPGRWRREGLHRADGQRKGAGREAREACRSPRQACRRNPQGHGIRRRPRTRKWPRNPSKTTARRKKKSRPRSQVLPSHSGAAGVGFFVFTGKAKSANTHRGAASKGHGFRGCGKSQFCQDNE